MYRSTRVPSAAGRGVRCIRRRLTTEAGAPSELPKKKPRILRRIFWTTTTLVGTFYVASPFIGFNNQKYYDFFSDHVPLGQPMLEYAESHSWETMTVQSVFESSKNTALSAQRYVMDKINGTTPPVEKKVEKANQKVHSVKDTAAKNLADSKSRIQSIASHITTDVQKMSDSVLSGKAGVIARHQADELEGEIGDLIRSAERAIIGVFPDHVTKAPSSAPSATPAAPAPAVVSNEHIYGAPLPIGFEPPPGYSRPAPPKKPDPPSPGAPKLPVLSSSLTGSEPIIAHLAQNIDTLTSFLASNPSATTKVAPVLENAKKDLTALTERIEKVREEERASLEARLDEQDREYTIKLLELEMTAQDKFDRQEDDYKKFFEEEQAKMRQEYREKVDNELRTQTELINERLKEQVISQGVELQRRWIREVKVHVEQERGGRLSKLDEMSTQLKRLERVALDNSLHLDENIRIHALWSAIRAVSSVLSSPIRKPFRDELRILRHIAVAREDPVVTAALDALEGSEVPDIGVEPFADLASWFTTSVAPKVSHVALVPDQDAGVLSHLASHFLSGFRFKRHGLVEGKDVLSVLARAEYYLNEKDLDGAARELNQLQGTAKVLLHDWLDAARKRLEVQQALEVVQTQATLASLLVV